MKWIVLPLLLAILLSGCANAEPIPETEPVIYAEVTQPIEPEAVEEEAEALIEAPPPPVSVILEPEAPGVAEERCDTAVIDYSNAVDGYVMAQYFGETDRRLKVLVKGPTTTYNYDLPQGQWTVFPLSDGNGSYQVGVYINAVDNKYATVMTANFEVSLEDEFAPFLRPNQYVDYVDAPNTMALGAELCAGLEDSLEKVAVVYDYVITNITYDEEKAANVKSGYLPKLDLVMEERKGICFDYAAVMTAMLRSQQIPCKLVVGYAGTIYHTWISVWTEENGWIDGAIFFDGHVWKRMDPTFAASAESAEEILEFIENGDYTVKYLY